MPAGGQLADLPYPQSVLPVADPRASLGQFQPDRLAVRQRRFDLCELGDWPLTLGKLVVANAGDAVCLPHLLEEFRAVPFAVEEDHEACAIAVGLKLLRSRLAGDFLEQTRHDVGAQYIEKSVVDRPFDREERLAQNVVDPVVGRSPKAQPLSGDIASGQAV